MGKKKGLKVIVAGGRDIKDEELVAEAIVSSGFEIAELVHGDAPGVDTIADKWADSKGIKTKPFPADWNDLEQPGAVIKTRYNKWRKRDEQYNANAGFYRNQQMADYADALIAVPDPNGSPGTQDMIKRAKAKGLQIYEFKKEKADSDYEYQF